MRSRYKAYNSGNENIYFLTSTIVQWIPVFVHKDHFDILIKSLEFCRKQKVMKLYAYVIMENHIHLMASAPDLANTMRAFKVLPPKGCLKVYQKKLWIGC